MAVKDKLQRHKAPTFDREKFTACGQEAQGGAQNPGIGTTCIGGMQFFWTKYQGRDERFTKRCQCLLDWLQRNPRPEAV